MWVVSADRDNILVTWWERGMTNATSDEPVGRMSADGLVALRRTLESWCRSKKRGMVTRNLLSAGQDNLSSNS
jgi:hypothetical protein